MAEEAVDQWGKPIVKKNRTRKEAIHAFCHECNGTQAFNENNDCVDKNCYLFVYRPGGGEGTIKTQTPRNPDTLFKP